MTTRRRRDGVSGLLRGITDDIKDFVDDEVIDRGRTAERDLRRSGRNFVDGRDGRDRDGQRRDDERGRDERDRDGRDGDDDRGGRASEMDELRAAIAELSRKVSQLSDQAGPGSGGSGGTGPGSGGRGDGPTRESS